MNREHVESGLTSVVTSYARRWMENNYDRLMQTDPAVKLMTQGKSTRYAIEVGLYALWAYIYQKWPERSALDKHLKNFVSDAPSEVSKRLLNGFREKVLDAKGLSNDSGSWATEVLLSLDDASLHGVLQWAVEAGPEQREYIRSALRSLPPEAIAKLAGLSNDDHAVALSLLNPTRQKQKRQNRSAYLSEEIKAAHDRLDAVSVPSAKQKEVDPDA